LRLTLPVFDEALAAHLIRKDTALTDEQTARIQKLINEAKREGR